MTALVLAVALVSKTGFAFLPDDKLGPPDLVESIKARRANGKLLQLDRMLLHSPEFTRGWNAMFGAIRGKLALPGKLRELSIMAVAVLNKAPYEWEQHEAEFLKSGGTAAELEAIRKLDASPFNESEKAALQLTVELTRDVQPKQETVERVRKLLGDQQAIELIGTISGYNMVSRFLLATGIETEK
ncbi:MAG TPA: carboxymuconolactone decarboxylase family protein [Myxococcales bacterium]|nr:carboxymuconolactone decarboxylase family protein [Myxococcales bacterium]